MDTFCLKWTLHWLDFAEEWQCTARKIPKLAFFLFSSYWPSRFQGRVCDTQADHETLHGLLYSQAKEGPVSSRLWIGRAHDVFEFTTFKRVRKHGLPSKAKQAISHEALFCCGWSCPWCWNAVIALALTTASWTIALLVKYSVTNALHNFICASQASGTKSMSLNYEALRCFGKTGLGPRWMSCFVMYRFS